MKALLFIIFIIILIPTVQAGAVVNGGFETGNTTGWTKSYFGTYFWYASTTAAYTGTYGLYMDTSGINDSSSAAYQNVDLTDVGSVSFDVNVIENEGKVIFFQFDYDYSNEIYTWNITSTTSGWEHKTISTGSRTGVHRIMVGIMSGLASNATMYVDNVETIPPVLTGYVKNNLGNPVSAATITLNNSGGSTTSNDTGYYELTGLLSYTYLITATSPTHEDYSDTISIIGDTEKNISMTRLTPALSNVGIIDSSESTLRIGWKENAVVDSVRIYQGTNTNLIATEDTSYVSLASYTVGNLEADTGYNFWLEPWDGAVSGSKYYVSGTTDGDGGGGGGGGGGSPTPTATGTPAPTSPPWTNITDEDWLNLTRYEQEYILFEHDQLNITIGTYTPKPVNLSFWYLILFLGICSTAYGSQKKNGELLFTCGLVAVVISMIKLGLF